MTVAPTIDVGGGHGPEQAILVEGLSKAFGGVQALADISLAVPPATVTGILGPNGAGKTTMISVLTTLIRPDAGRALIKGRDVGHQPAVVRRMIGVAGQSTALESELTGRENLQLIGYLHHLRRAQVRSRAADLIGQFDLGEFADRPTKTLSGGMARRLDLAASLVGEPDVLFLDEPTVGLDPRARLAMWQTVRSLVAKGMTLLLTTQNMEEANELADRIVVFDRGRVIASGTPDHLKSRVGGDVLRLAVSDRSRLGDVVGLLGSLDLGAPQVDVEAGTLAIGVGDRGSEPLVEVVRNLDRAGIAVHDVELRRPSLDDVFLALTGRGSAVPDGNGDAEADRGPR